MRKLNSRREAVNRVLNFLICGIGESQGTKWKGGNPYPSPFFDRVREDSPALISMSSLPAAKDWRPCGIREAPRLRDHWRDEIT